MSAWTIAKDVHVSLGDADFDLVAGPFTATDEAEERALQMLAGLDEPMAELVTFEHVATPAPEPEPVPGSDAPPEPPVSGSPPEPATSDPGGASEPGEADVDHSDQEASA